MLSWYVVRVGKTINLYVIRSYMSVKSTLKLFIVIWYYLNFMSDSAFVAVTW